MAGDNKSRAYSPDEKHEHVYLCKKWPQLRMVYVRVGDEKHVKGQAEKYLGFLQTAAGGIFQTNNDAVAAYIEDTEAFKDGVIEKLTHEELGKILLMTPAESKVTTGPVGTAEETERKPEPVAPDERERPVPKAAKGVKRKPELAAS